MMARKKADILKEVDDLCMEALPEITRQLLDAALGLKIAVWQDEEMPPRARKIGEGRTEDMERVHIYQFPPDPGLLRYWHEHLAGKARVREEKGVDPVVNVHFGDLETDWETPDEVEIATRAQGVKPEKWTEEDHSKRGIGLDSYRPLEE